MATAAQRTHEHVSAFSDQHTQRNPDLASLLKPVCLLQGVQLSLLQPVVSQQVCAAQRAHDAATAAAAKANQASGKLRTPARSLSSRQAAANDQQLCAHRHCAGSSAVCEQRWKFCLGRPSACHFCRPFQGRSVNDVRALRRLSAHEEAEARLMGQRDKGHRIDNLWLFAEQVPVDLAIVTPPPLFVILSIGTGAH